MEIKLGAHVSISKGYTGALNKIVEIGGNCLQMFSGSPRGWSLSVTPQSQIDEFTSLKEKLGIDPVYFHASYLINLADGGRVGYLSKSTLINELKLAGKMGVRGSIVHPGSFKDRGDEPAYDNKNYRVLIENIMSVLADSPPETVFIIENAGMRKVGKSIKEIARIIKDLKSERVRVCLDTCHLHAAGYDVSDSKKLDKFLDDFDKSIGVDKIELWHMNDSRDPFGSFRDRHENIGEGKIGIDAFRAILNHSKMRHLPFVIETPGFEKQGADVKNINILKSLI